MIEVMATKWVYLLLIVGLAAAYTRGISERPKYQVIAADQNIEIRQYEPMIIAEVEIEGNRRKSVSPGFRILARYIFGNNRRHQTGDAKIAMTAPVQQQESQKIEMTAPVQQQENQKIAMTAPVQQQSEGKSWLISFVMPSEYTMESLPEPNDDRVTLKAVGAQKFAVIKFLGSKNGLDDHEKQLRSYVERNQLETTGAIKYAFYSPPWILPSMRHNEVMVELVNDEAQ